MTYANDQHRPPCNSFTPRGSLAIRDEHQAVAPGQRHACVGHDGQGDGCGLVCGLDGNHADDLPGRVRLTMLATLADAAIGLVSDISGWRVSR